MLLMDHGVVNGMQYVEELTKHWRWNKMPTSRVLIGKLGDQNDAVVKFQRDSDDDGAYDDIDLQAFELDVSDSTVILDFCKIDGGTYGS